MRHERAEERHCRWQAYNDRSSKSLGPRVLEKTSRDGTRGTRTEVLKALSPATDALHQARPSCPLLLYARKGRVVIRAGEMVIHPPSRFHT